MCHHDTSFLQGCIINTPQFIFLDEIEIALGGFKEYNPVSFSFLEKNDFSLYFPPSSSQTATQLLMQS
jgi:hypothetical protein